MLQGSKIKFEKDIKSGFIPGINIMSVLTKATVFPFQKYFWLISCSTRFRVGVKFVRSPRISSGVIFVEVLRTSTEVFSLVYWFIYNQKSISFDGREAATVNKPGRAWTAIRDVQKVANCCVAFIRHSYQDGVSHTPVYSPPVLNALHFIHF